MATKDVDNEGISEEDRPYTPEDLLKIINAPSGGLSMLPSDAYNEVYPNILLGEESIAKQRVQLQKLGVTHVLNTAEGKDDGYHVHTNHVMYRKVNIEYLGIPATDMMSFNLSKYFNKCADYIEDALSNGGKILVNCKVGASRSATIVLAFLMLKRHLPVQDAVRLVRKEREICPNDGFLQQLCDLNEILKKKGHFKCTEEIR
ncbi:dual specificity protein phosphatase 3-like [Ruditapes philippinarum]|uniref:dual specificity protein phosphatase 3-like n=1 Tax=Ruditapes philippinarum TaxID=129788 RepID=UPI00295BB3A2|nr:dual specificity protein phosphatase 3-like [Ruditapes philippinarum]